MANGICLTALQRILTLARAWGGGGCMGGRGGREGSGKGAGDLGCLAADWLSNAPSFSPCVCSLLRGRGIPPLEL